MIICVPLGWLPEGNKISPNIIPIEGKGKGWKVMVLDRIEGQQAFDMPIAFAAAADTAA